MAAIWVADTEPNERFTMYTRGNVGEVFPHVMTALTGTMIGDAIRQAQSEVFVEMGVLRPDEVVGPSVGTGVFGGYLYMSGSTMRLFGVRMPGMSWRDADEQVIGNVEGVPRYEPSKGDRNLLATWAMDPMPVYAAIDRLRHAPTNRDPVVATKRLAADAADALVEALRFVPRPLRWLARRAFRPEACLLHHGRRIG